MNAGPTNTHSPHLGLEDLLAEVNGQAIDHLAREHLATCGDCHAEALRWGTVAGGVRALAAATPEVAQPAWPRRTGLPALAGRKPRAMLAVGAAAVLLLIGGVSYGVTAAFTTGHATSPAGTKTAALTRVSGCADLKQAAGTLEHVNGTSVVIKTANGQLVTVTTTGSTMVNVSGAPLSDITDGASVIAAGRESGGVIAASSVGIGSPFRPFGRHGKVVTPPGIVAVQGTVADASTGGFTVVTPAGTQVQVTISSDTKVDVLHASLSQLQTGAVTIAVGHAGPDGTLAAAAITQPPPQWRGHIEYKGCSPASVDDAITTALITSH
jgi:hypothetical protein